MDEQRMGRMLDEIQEKASVKAAFGEVQQVGDRAIIPVAQVTWGGGFGYGRGTLRRRQQPASSAADEAAPSTPGEPAADGSESSGGGGGGYLKVKPVAVLEVSSGETRVRPVVDSTSIAIAGILLGAWNVFWISVTLRAIFGRNR